jgi:hypothetical protein
MVVLFGDLFVVLLLSTFLTLASLNDAFSATYRRLFSVEFNDVFWPHLTSSKTIYNKFNVARDRSIRRSSLTLYVVETFDMGVVFLFDSSVDFTHKQYIIF